MQVSLSKDVDLHQMRACQQPPVLPSMRHLTFAGAIKATTM
jgi:hypothetical protein